MTLWRWFGDKTSENLINQLKRSATEQVEDWRFLAAFGVGRMGMGNCENLLKSYPLSEIFDLSLEQIANIDGFAQLTAKVITEGLKSISDEFDLLSNYGFNLEKTILKSATQSLSHMFFGKKLIFTGKMSSSRDKMKKNAKSIGVQVVSSVSSKTDFLVIGKNVGQKKIQNAKKFGVKVITEDDYLLAIDG